MNVLDPITLLIIVLIGGLFVAIVYVYVDFSRTERTRQTGVTPPPANTPRPNPFSRRTPPPQNGQTPGGFGRGNRFGAVQPQSGTTRPPAPPAAPQQNTAANGAYVADPQTTAVFGTAQTLNPRLDGGEDDGETTPLGGRTSGLRPRTAASRPRTGSITTRSRPVIAPQNVMGELSGRWSSRWQNITNGGKATTPRLRAAVRLPSVARGAAPDGDFGDAPTRRSFAINDGTNRGEVRTGAISAKALRFGSDEDYYAAMGADSPFPPDAGSDQTTVRSAAAATVKMDEPPPAATIDADGDGFGGDAAWSIPEHAAELGNVDGFETRAAPPVQPARVSRARRFRGETTEHDVSPAYGEIDAEATAAGYDDTGELEDAPDAEEARRNYRQGRGRAPRPAYNIRVARRAPRPTQLRGPGAIIAAVVAVVFIVAVFAFFAIFFSRGAPLSADNGRLAVFVAPLGEGVTFTQTNLSQTNANRLKDAITAALNGSTPLDPKNTTVQTVSQTPISKDADARTYLNPTGGNADMVVWGYTDTTRNVAVTTISLGYNGPYADATARNDLARRVVEPQTVQVVEPLPTDPAQGVTPGAVQNNDGLSATAQTVLALAHYFRGDYIDARTAIINAQRVATPGTLGPLYFWQATIDLALGSYTEAIAEYRQAGDASLQNASSVAPAYIYTDRGVAEWRANQYDEANRDFLAALGNVQADPNATTTSAPLLARIYSDQGIAKLTLANDTAGALDSLERANRLDATNPLTATQLAQLYHRLGRTDDALTLLDAAIKLDPTLPAPHTEKGFILLELGKADAAATEFDTARKLTDTIINGYQADATRANGAGDTNRNVYATRQSALYNADDEAVRVGQARILLEQARKEGNVQGGTLDGIVRGIQGKKTAAEQAEAAFRDIIARDPKSFDGHFYLAETLWLKGDTAGALAEYDAAKQAAPNRPDIYGLLANRFFAINQPDKALATLNEYVAKFPDDDSYQQAIMGDLAVGKATDAAALADKMLKANPTSGLPHYLRGHVWIAQGNLPEAQKELELAVQLNERLADAWYDLGNVTFARNDHNRAFDAYTRTVDLAPTSYAKAHYFLGLIYNDERNDPEHALTEWLTAVRINPTQDDAYYRLGLLYAQRNRLGDAADAFQHAITARPNRTYPEASYQLGLVQQKQGDLANAEKNLWAALAGQPNYPDAHIALSNILLGEGKADDAVNEARAALQTNPKSVPALLALGDALFARSDFNNASQSYVAAAGLDPNNAQAQYGQGRVLLETGKNNQDTTRINAAIGYFDAAIKRDPNYAPAYIGRGQADLAKDDSDSAITDFGQAIRADGKNTVAWVGQGDAQVRKKDTAAAITSYKQALAINPNDADAHYGLAQIYAGQSRPDLGAAVSEYQAAIKARPTWPNAYYYMGKALQGLNRVEDAKAAFRTAAQQNPAFVEPLFELGNIAYNAGQRDDALTQYDAALKIDPKYAPAWLQEGLCYEYTSRPQQAIDAYRKALANADKGSSVSQQAAAGLARLGAQ